MLAAIYRGQLHLICVPRISLILHYSIPPDGLFRRQLPVRLGARVRRARQLVGRDRHLLRPAAQPGAVLQR